MRMVAANAAETSARAPGVVIRKMLLSTSASFGADGGGEAIPGLDATAGRRQWDSRVGVLGAWTDRMIVGGRPAAEG